MDFNDYDLNNIDYNIISNNDFNDISSKKQKYLNLKEKIDKTINEQTAGKDGIISTNNSKVKILSVTTDEEYVIAKDTYDLCK